LSVNKVFVAGLFLTLFWCLLFWQGITTAVSIWLESDVFNHCLFVLPGAFFLMYMNRDKLSINEILPNLWVLPLCIGCLVLYAIGLAGQLQLFMHIATFSFLPLAIWAYIGNKLAYKLMFPLFFILFCIPIGEELVPNLQEITADLSVVMLNWTSIPIYRSGLYIEIPNGRFLVAEACSGISFLISSLVIGSLYSYLNIRSTKRRILFVSISILFPIIANAIRVFGIIVIAYLSNMEYAVGADHLIYGWFFFAFVLICLLGIGELVREKGIVEEKSDTLTPKMTKPLKTNKIKVLFAIQGTVYLIFLWWFNNIQHQLEIVSEPTKIQLKLEGAELLEQHKIKQSPWEPLFPESFDAAKLIINADPLELDIFVAWYPAGQGELISSLNRFYQQEHWTQESVTSISVSEKEKVSLLTLVSANETRLLSYWYIVDGKIFGDQKLAKLYEIYRVLLGEYRGGGVVAISSSIERMSLDPYTKEFEKNIGKLMPSLSQSFEF
tara:strand:+ start:6464 stop:7951 length:1488 start_codon:yes stop_codon:yes gene_type:complete